MQALAHSLSLISTLPDAGAALDLDGPLFRRTAGPEIETRPVGQPRAPREFGPRDILHLAAEALLVRGGHLHGDGFDIGIVALGLLGILDGHHECVNEELDFTGLDEVRFGLQFREAAGCGKPSSSAAVP